MCKIMGCINSKPSDNKSAIVVPVVSAAAQSSVSSIGISSPADISLQQASPVPEFQTTSTAVPGKAVPTTPLCCASYPFIAVGLRFHCLDEFVSKYTGETMCKWRAAEVVSIVPGSKNTIKVHFEGWNSNTDIVLDLDEHAEYIRFAPWGLLPESQLNSGGKLTAKQEKVVVAYIARFEEHFELPMGPGSRRNSKTVLEKGRSKNHLTQSSDDRDKDNRGGAVSGTASSGGGAMNDLALEANESNSSQSRSSALLPPLLFVVGEAVDVQDEYKSKAAHPNLTVLLKKQSMSKLPWRPAVVREVTPDRVRVHYVGWGDEWDEVIDVTSTIGLSRICKGNQKTSLQNGGWSQFQTSNAALNASSLEHRQGPQSGFGGNVTTAAVVPPQKVARRRKSQDNDKMYQAAAEEESRAHLYHNPSFHRLEPLSVGTGRTRTNAGTPSSALNDVSISGEGSNLDSGPSNVTADKGGEGIFKDKGNGNNKGKGKGKLPISPYRQRSKVRIDSNGNGGVVDSNGTATPVSVTTDGGDGHSVLVTDGAALSRQSRQSFPGPGRVSSKEVSFETKLARLGMHVVEIVGDGNCLFRAVAHQMYLDQERHGELRAKCCAHMLKYKHRFEAFCTDNFETYVKHLSNEGVWGDHLEIKALEEIFDRIIIIYEAEGATITPMNYINVEEQEAVNGKNTSSYTTLKREMEIEPILLSYHGRVHYNSIFNEKWNLPLPARYSNIITTLRNKKDT